MASARHWGHKERLLAATGVGDKHMCCVPPQITQRWLFSVEDRYTPICFINFMAHKTLNFDCFSGSFTAWILFVWVGNQIGKWGEELFECFWFLVKPPTQRAPWSSGPIRADPGVRQQGGRCPKPQHVHQWPVRWLRPSTCYHLQL